MKINKSLSHFLLLQKKGWYFTLTLLLLSIAYNSKAQTVTVGTSTLTDTHCPIHSYYGFNYSQTIYLASELTAGGATGPSFITSISYYYNTPSTPENTWDHWVIYMKNSSKSLFTGDTDWDNSLTQVYSGTINIPATGGQWITINLDSPFLWDGTNNLIIGVNEDVPGFTSSPGAEFRITEIGAPTDYRTLLYYEDQNNPNHLAPPAANYSVNAVANTMFDLTPASNCSGTPNSAFATSSNTLVCPNAAFNLGLTNTALGIGLTYQWQSSPNGTTWTNLGSPQTAFLYTVPSISATTYYQCITTCTASALSATSTPVVVNSNPTINCYCTPATISCANTSISNVMFETLSDSPVCDGATGYTYNTTNTVTINANQSYTLSTTFGTQANAYFGVWIDYNQDGTFDSNEFTDLGNGMSGTLTGSINIPFTAIGGNTRMRIKTEADWTNTPILNPCSSYGYDGQTLDYPIFINAVTSCTGTPSISNATSTVSSICENTPFTLDLTNNDIASNMSYQWQSSTDNIVWTNLGSPQTTVPYTISTQSTTSYYRCLTTCITSSNTSTSTTWVVTQNALTTCYCIPGEMDCAGDAMINYVAFAAMTNTSSCAAYGYSDFTGSVSSATVSAGQSYTLTTVLGYMYGQHTHAWIDYNQDGEFQSTEHTDLLSNSGNDTIAYTINIPVTATPGVTRMRVRNISGNSLGAADACNTPTNAPKSASTFLPPSIAAGETEDYLVTILPPDCGSVNFPPTIPISGTSNICLGGTSTIDVSASIPVASGITYQWHEDTGSGFGGPIPNNAIINAMPSVNTSYYCDIVCNSTIIRISDTILVNVNIVSMTPTTTSVSCNGLCNGSISVNANSTGLGGFTYSISPGSFTTNTVTNLCANTYTIDVTNSIGCLTTQTVAITEPAPIVATPSYTDISCYGLTDGIATVNVTGGISPLNFSWLPTGGTALTANNLAAGNYTFNISDGNGCTLNQTVTITEPPVFSASIMGSASSICEQLEDTIKSTIVGGTMPYSYNWMELPSNSVSTNSDYTYTTSIGTFSYGLNVIDANNCVANSNTISITVNPSSNFSGTVTTIGAAPVAGRVVLYKYLPFYTKFDSVAGQNISGAGDFLFNSFTSGIYIIKAIPTATNMQIAYGAAPGDTAVAWKDAQQIIHGCAVNDIQNIFVKPLTVLTNTTGISGKLSGGIYGGPSYGQRMGDFGGKPTIPGTPIGGIIVKGGKNPGGQMFVQTVTDMNGDYSLVGLPPNTGNESYFILVDIPGLDTNHTYHRVIDINNNDFQGLDFLVDSAKINPLPSSAVSVNDISAIENQIKVFPNPATNLVSIKYHLKTNSLVTIELFDMLGKSVKMLLPETQQNVEAHQNTWQINDVSSGLYFIKMTINGTESTIKLSVTN
jgi:hypothetical protein